MTRLSIENKPLSGRSYGCADKTGSSISVSSLLVDSSVVAVSSNIYSPKDNRLINVFLKLKSIPKIKKVKNAIVTTVTIVKDDSVE
jgi:hypothetical protein